MVWGLHSQLQVIMCLRARYLNRKQVLRVEISQWPNTNEEDSWILCRRRYVEVHWRRQASFWYASAQCETHFYWIKSPSALIFVVDRYMTSSLTLEVWFSLRWHRADPEQDLAPHLVNWHFTLFIPTQFEDNYTRLTRFIIILLKWWQPMKLHTSSVTHLFIGLHHSSNRRRRRISTASCEVSYVKISWYCVPKLYILELIHIPVPWNPSNWVSRSSLMDFLQPSGCESQELNFSYLNFCECWRDVVQILHFKGGPV